MLLLRFLLLAVPGGSAHKSPFSWPQPAQRTLGGFQVAPTDQRVSVDEDSVYEYPISGDDELLALHKALVSIPSESGNENAIALFLEQYLKSHNFEVELQSVPPLLSSTSFGAHEHEGKPRFNVFAYPPGHRQTPLLLTSHIDTVPPYIPYRRHHHNEIWGRGTVDAKACVATQFRAYSELVRDKQIEAKEASLLFVVGEEVSGDGMHAANSLGMQWKVVIFGEPTELKLASGHKGLVGVTVNAKGRGGHSGYPELGESAVDMILPALMKLKEVQMPSSEKYGNTTVNIGRIRAGVAANVIAQEAEANIGIRIAAGGPQMVKSIVFDALKSVDDRLEVSWSLAAYGPVDIDHDVPGFEVITVNYGTDIPNMKGQHKRYLYGPGSILVAHGDDEHLKVQDLYEAVSGYKKLVLFARSQWESS